MLALTLLLSYGYAGMILVCQIAVLPPIRQLRPNDYADAWQVVDLYTDHLLAPDLSSLTIINAGEEQTSRLLR